MSNLTVEQFLNLVQRSELVDAPRLAEVIASVSRGKNPPTDSRGWADALRDSEILTSWQCKNLLDGKPKGFILGAYRLLDHLGTGGMSSVFLAEHRLLRRRVAIKVLPQSKVRDASFLDRFLREARVMARLSHPNVVRAYDLQQHKGTYFLVLEYVAGEDLRQRVLRTGPLPLCTAAYFIAQTALGLQHAHDGGLVHRDIKPANLLIRDDDCVKILDLGLARTDNDEEAASLTLLNAENVMGTADYLAPEQARDAHSVTPLADIYSLGCTLYFALCGQPPFHEGTIPQRLIKHQTERPADVRALRSDCPHAIADVCMTMLAKQPEHRIASAGEVARRLVRWLQSQDFAPAESLLTEFDGASLLAELPDWESPANNPVMTGRSGSGVADEEATVPPLEASVSAVPWAIDTTDDALLAKRQRNRRRTAVRTPRWLWGVMGGLFLVALGLFVYWLRRG